MTAHTLDLLGFPLVQLDGTQRTLPGVLAFLSTGREGHYAALQPHQAHVWHMLLVQLAVVAMERAGAEAPFETEDEWRDALAALTDDPSAWWLHQDDLNRPAFLQPPLPDGAKALTKLVETPDAMDVLSTSKNHDVKRFRAVHPTPELWLFSLVTLQTSSGVLGRGNYGVTRMNGGYASRACVGFYRELGWAERFREDVARVSEGLTDLYERDFDPDGPALLWTLPWGAGKEPLTLNALHPCFVEVCRRVRFHDGAWRAGNSASERIGAKQLKGDVGDPWLPIKADGGALNVQGTGFTFKLLVDLMGDRYRFPPYMLPEAQTRWLVCAVLAGQQGGTNGYHSRTLEIPPSAAMQFSTPEGRELLVERAQDNRERAADVRRRCLLPALLTLYEEDIQHGRGHQPHLDAFEQSVDAVFFARLWADLTHSGTDARDTWLRQLHALASTVLQRASTAAPRRVGASFKRRARATSIFEGSFRKNFPLEAAHAD